MTDSSRVRSTTWLSQRWYTCGVLSCRIVASSFRRAELSKKSPPIGLELDRGVETDLGRIVTIVGEALNAQKQDLTDASLTRALTPQIGRPPGIGQTARAVHQKDRFPADPEISRVLECVGQPVDVPPIVGVVILLRH
jgi:hypothetical protein